MKEKHAEKKEDLHKKNEIKENENEEIKVENGSDEKKVANASEELVQLRKQIETLQKERDSYKDMMIRKAADLENYRRAKEKEISDLFKYSSERFILKVLEVYDDLEKSLAYLDNENNFSAVKDGVILVYNKFSKALENEEVKKIEAEGADFDFNFHDALMQQPTDEMDPNKVMKVIENGYMYKDKILKHAKVIVSVEKS